MLILLLANWINVLSRAEIFFNSFPSESSDGTMTFCDEGDREVLGRQVQIFFSMGVIEKLEFRDFMKHRKYEAGTEPPDRAKQGFAKDRTCFVYFRNFKRNTR